MQRADRSRIVLGKNLVDARAERYDHRLQPGDAAIGIFIRQVVQIHIHRRAAIVGDHAGKPHNVLHELLVAARQQPELSLGDRASNVIEQRADFNALRRNIVKKLANFGQDAFGIARTHVRFERYARTLHLLVGRSAESQRHAHFCSRLHAEVGELLLLHLGDATFIQCVANTFENVGAVLHEPAGAHPAAALLISDAEEYEVALEGAVSTRNCEKRVELAEANRLHVQRSAAPDLIEENLGGERRPFPMFRRRGHHIDVIEKQQALAGAASLQTCVDVSPSGSRLDHLRLHAIFFEQVGEKLRAWQFMPCDGVDADIILQQTDLRCDAFSFRNVKLRLDVCFCAAVVKRNRDDDRQQHNNDADTPAPCVHVARRRSNTIIARRTMMVVTETHSPITTRSLRYCMTTR